MIAETIEGTDCKVEIHYDEDGSYCNPRDNDNLTRILGSHRSYTIGDGEPDSQHREALERGGFKLLERYLRLCEGCVAFSPLGMIDHSGISFYLGGGSHWSDSAGWDSGTVGYVYVTRERVIELCDEDWDGSLDEAMAAEVQGYDRWARGEVYWYAVIDDRGETLDSCGGLIGSEYAEEAAREALAQYDYAPENLYVDAAPVEEVIGSVAS